MLKKKNVMLLHLSHERSDWKIKVVLQELQHCRTFCSREAGLVAFFCFFSVRIVLVSKTRGVEGRLAQIYFCSP